MNPRQFAFLVLLLALGAAYHTRFVFREQDAFQDRTLYTRAEGRETYKTTVAYDRWTGGHINTDASRYATYAAGGLGVVFLLGAVGAFNGRQKTQRLDA